MSRKVTIIGGGPGGYPAAIILAQQGVQVTLIEQDKLGGTCLNRGCIPTKVLLEASHVLRQMKTAQRMGIRVKEVEVDYSILRKHKDSVVEGLVKGVEKLCEARKIRMVKGTGVLETPQTVRIRESGEAVKGDAVVLATGSVPAKIPVPGADGPGVIDSDQALSLLQVPPSMVIIGAGYIGLEFAQIFHGLGAKVTVLEMLPRALPNEDQDVANELERALKQEGIQVLTEVTVKEISGEEGRKKVNYTVKGQDHTVEAALVMLAVGRRPNTEGLGLEKAGVKTEKGGVVVNPFMETSAPGIFAVGDAIGGITLAHVATAEGHTAADCILGNKHPLNYKAVPRCIYTYPEAASVGLTEAEAKKKYGEILVGRFPLQASGKARIVGGSGFAKVIAEKQYREIVGVHLVGPHVTEMIAGAGTAMNLECTGEELAHTIHPHPTISEMIMEAAMAVEGFTESTACEAWGEENMILGLSHMGLTVSKLDSSLDYYQKNLGFTVLSDAERKGEWVEKITGIPGFHTRTVYLSLSPRHHFEVFGFFHPPAIPPERESRFRVGILGCVLDTDRLESLLIRDDPEEARRWAPLLGRKEEPFSGCRVIHLKDPDGSSLRVLEEKIGRMKAQSALADLRYPVFLVENMEASLSFYVDLLGLHVDGRGKNSRGEIEGEGATPGRSVRWAVLRSKAGFCLKLVSPADSEILPAAPWKMQRIGFTHAAFGVENLEGYYLRLKDKVNFKSPPTPVNAGPHQGGHAVYLTSPEGITLEFIDSPLIRESWKR